MQKSESIGNLAKALSVVQGKLEPAVKDSTNPFFKAKYADLNSVWDSCRSLLSENGLSVAQLPGTGTGGEQTLTTILMHESNEWISDTVNLPISKNDSQGVGSALTYFRRYGLAAIVGIVSDDDDDGNFASQKPAVTQQSQPQAHQQKRPPNLQQEHSLKMAGYLKRIGELQIELAEKGIEVEKEDTSKMNLAGLEKYGKELGDQLAARKRFLGEK